MRSFFYSDHNKKTDKNRADLIKRLTRYSFFLVAVPFLFLYSFRETEPVHNLILGAYQHPVVFKAPVVVFLLFFVGGSFFLKFKKKSVQFRDLFVYQNRFYYHIRYRPSNLLMTSLILTFFVFLLSLFFTFSLNQIKTYQNADFRPISALPESEVPLFSLKKGMKLIQDSFYGDTANLKSPGAVFWNNKILYSAHQSGRPIFKQKSKRGVVLLDSFSRIPKINFSQKTPADFNLYQRDFFSQSSRLFLPDQKQIVFSIGYKNCFFCFASSPYLKATYLVDKNATVTKINSPNQPVEIATALQESFFYQEPGLADLFQEKRPKTVVSPVLVKLNNGPAYIALSGPEEGLVDTVFVFRRDKNQVFFLPEKIPSPDQRIPLGFRRSDFVAPVFQNNQIFYLFSKNASGFFQTKLVGAKASKKENKKELKEIISNLDKKLKEQERLIDQIKDQV